MSSRGGIAYVQLLRNFLSSDRKTNPRGQCRHGVTTKKACYVFLAYIYALAKAPHYQ
ncbi:hypothetical protein [Rickettsia endosymbiont of Pantilius tunicatus]|uniref:hypothetical protein n=1 Tax=Rickettsia endosymbiont of Pantilius tunicatus TaxID=3066267 RepID=UPI00376F283E